MPRLVDDAWQFDKGDQVILIEKVGAWPEAYWGEISFAPSPDQPGNWNTVWRNVHMKPGKGLRPPKGGTGRPYLVTRPESLAPFCRLEDRPASAAMAEWGQF